MPEPNVEIYARMIEAFNREGVEGLMRYFAEDAQVYTPTPPGTAPIAAVRRSAASSPS